MKNKNTFSILLLLSIVLFVACSGPKDPTFQKIENLQVKSMSATNIAVSGDMTMHNPNAFSCHFKNLDMEVISEDDVVLTHIEQTYNTEMPAKQDFMLPVVVNFAPDKLISEKDGLLLTLLNVLNNKEVTLRYKGTCTIEVMEISIKVPFDFNESILLKQ